jgi:hypothetical protein
MYRIRPTRSTKFMCSNIVSLDFDLSYFLETGQLFNMNTLVEGMYLIVLVLVTMVYILCFGSTLKHHSLRVLVTAERIMDT